MSLTTLFIDFNAYFASVEQQLLPELRGRPVAVTPVLAPSGCCIAASYEAKRFGVTTGTRVREAIALCPELVLVKARPSIYVQMHHELVRAVERCLPVHSVHSIDEMSCRLARGEREPHQATALAERVKASIRTHVGEHLRCSIGIAPNRFLAKLATDMRKPDGLLVITREELPACLFHLKLTDLPGIGPRMRERLERKGIVTVEQLYAQSEREMETIWESVVGRRWFLYLRGEDVEELPTQRRSIGHQHVLPPQMRTAESSRAIAIRLLHKAAARMRQLKYWPERVTLALSLEERSGTFLFDSGSQPAPPQPAPIGWARASWHASAAFPGGCVDTLELTRALGVLWDQRPPGRLRLIGVTFSDLIAEDQATLPLFGHARNRVALAKAVDQINDRYGRSTVYSAAVHEVKDAARGGIAFGYIPDVSLPDSVE